VLVLGIAGGAVLASVAGARRTDSAYPRFVERQAAYDAIVPDAGTPEFHPNLDAISGLPYVTASARAITAAVPLGAGIGIIVPADARLGNEMNRAEILRGRAPDPHRADEVSVAFPIAERHHLEPGSRIPGVRSDHAPPELRVVGVHAAPGQFPPIARGTAGIQGTQELHARLSPELPDSLFVRLRHGAADFARFREDALLLRGGAQSQRALGQQAEDSMHLLAIGLWLLALLLAGVAALVVAYLFSRQTAIDAGPHPTLAALGMTRLQLWAVALGRVAAAAVAGALLAVLLAIAVSPVFPIGVARTAEPDPGLSVDGTTLALGGLAIVVVAVLLAALPAWHHARLRTDTQRATRASKAAAALARTRAPVPAVVGTGLALEAAPGRASVPVRSTILCATIGIAALVGAVTFGSSLRHLLGEPQLYGYTWDATVTNDGDPAFDFARRGRELVRGERAIDDVTFGQYVPFRVDGRQTGGLVLDDSASVALPVLEGRAPRGSGEIALGARTRDELGIGLGDRVSVAVDPCPTCFVRRPRLVGTVAIPSTATSNLGEGVFMTYAELLRFAPGVSSGSLFLEFRPGTTDAARTAALERVKGRYADLVDPGSDPAKAYWVLRADDEPTDIVNFGRVEALPFLVGGLLAAVAMTSIAYLLASAVRRRRRDLAVLKVLGFARRQVVATVLWQSIAFSAVVLLLGLPLGIVFGRWLYGLFAADRGVVARTVTSLGPLLVIVVVTLAVASVIGAFASRAAWRTRPAEVLHAE
jgi:hypothetical protein